MLCARKAVALKSAVGGIVKKGLDDTKGSGAKKLNKRLNEQYSGIRERKVQKTLGSSRCYQLHKARFGNKPVLKPVSIRLTSLIWESRRSSMAISHIDISSL